MQSTSFKESNFVIGGGQSGVNDLTISVAKNTRDYPGKTFSISKYKLSPEEIHQILQTGELYVCIMGHPQPPILPTVFTPFSSEFGYEPIIGVCMRCGRINADDMHACGGCGFPLIGKD